MKLKHPERWKIGCKHLVLCCTALVYVILLIAFEFKSITAITQKYKLKNRRKIIETIIREIHAFSIESCLLQHCSIISSLYIEIIYLPV